MLASLNEQYLEHTVLPIHIESFNKECVTIKEAYNVGHISVEFRNKTKWC